MGSDALRTVLRNSEGKTYRLVFSDGTDMSAEVVSATHVEIDDTVVILRVGASNGEPGWQVHLGEIESVAAAPRVEGGRDV
jgi:hypothetical protein